MNKISILAIVLAVLFPATANASGSVSVGVEYSSGTPVVVGGAPVVIHQYPNGRVVVEHVPVTHVYPHGESLAYQNGGTRVYSQGYGGASTCYVDCWHNGVRPGTRGGSGTSIHVGVGVTKTW
jgi:hypothetical protein